MTAPNLASSVVAMAPPRVIDPQGVYHVMSRGNARQNILNGPPLPAPPSFLGLAVIGLAALALMEAEA